MSGNSTEIEDSGEFQLLDEEIQAERVGFDLRERLGRAPKRKPEVVTIYLDEASISELGFARDIKNELGITVGRAREGLAGELDAEAAKPEDERDEKAIASIRKRIDTLVKKIKKDSLEFTLQWIPPLVEEALTVRAMKAIGVKQKPVPEAKIEAFQAAWLARALEAAIASVKDNMTGEVKDKFTVAEAAVLKQQIPKEQYARLDAALGRLLNRAAISQEVLDSADF